MADPIPFSSAVSKFVAPSATHRSSDQDSNRLEETCCELESIFVYYLLKEMRATVPKSGFFGGGKTEEMYTSILDQQLAKEIASKRELGISRALLQQLMTRYGDNIKCNKGKGDSPK